VSFGFKFCKGRFKEINLVLRNSVFLLVEIIAYSGHQNP